MRTGMMGITAAAAASLSIAATSGLAAQDAAKRPAPAARTAAGAHQRTDSARRQSTEPAERTLAAARVPQAVREAFSRAYPSATVSKWATEADNGRTVYEAESREGATHRDVLIGADGAIIEVETQVALAQLPAQVRSAATANRAHVERAEIVVMGRDTTYEFKIRGRQDELKLRGDGTPAPARP